MAAVDLEIFLLSAMGQPYWANVAHRGLQALHLQRIS